MSSYWQDKVVLVTGGTSGFGRRISEAFGRAGAKLTVFGLEPELTAKTAEEMKSAGFTALAVTGNVTNDADALRAVDETVRCYGRLDALVNAAGRTDRGWASELDPAAVLRLFDLNTLGALRMTKAALPYLAESKGHIVNIGSLAAKSASRWVGAYPTTKFALAALTQQFRLEEREKGIHVMLVCPGPIRRDDDRLYPISQSGIPESALRPGAGVKVGKIDPDWLAEKILQYCEKRKPELVVPKKARLLFAVSALFPRLGDWLVLKNT